MMNDQHDLELILRSHIALVTLATHEERRALELLARVAQQIGKPLKTWTCTDGLGSGDDPRELSIEGWPDTAAERTKHLPLTEPQAVLRAIKKERKPTLYALLDFHPYLTDAVVVRLLKEIALDHGRTGHTLILVSHDIEAPPELGKFCAGFSLRLPDEQQIEQLVIDEAKLWAVRNPGQKVRADKTAAQLLVRNLVGLTYEDAARLARNAIYDDGAITEADLPEIAKAKHELLGRDGVLSFEYDTARFSEVGGLKKLKTWLDTRKARFTDTSGNGPDAPKGILLLGVQGSGKSLASKAVAGAFGVPLLRLDFGALYNKFFGETEKNVREALKTAQMMAPCVLWCDEIEKGIATGDYDSGTSRRVLATLLNWMAENRSRVFIVATANDIRPLPPELIRKGRLDEIFFVDLPNEAIRQEIFAIHLRKRGLDAARVDTAALARASDGFSGAEIEQAVVAALYAVQPEELATRHILEELQRTKPLSVVMAEDIAALREWARDRTVAVD